MKLIKRALPLFVIFCIFAFTGCDRTKVFKDGLTNNSNGVISTASSTESSAASYNYQSNQSKVQSSSNVNNNNADNGIHEISQAEVKIKPEEAQEVAYKEAVKARDTVELWKGASVKYVRTFLLSAAPPAVRPISELNTDNTSRVPFDYKSPVYQVEFEDEKGTCSALLIFVDANTGKSIGGLYTSD